MQWPSLCTVARRPLIWLATGLKRCSCARASLALLLLMAGGTLPSADLSNPPEAGTPEWNEPIVPVPLNVMVNPNRVALGGRLFNDVRLSHNYQQSCATCHPLERGGMDGLACAIRSDGSPHFRNTPTIFNVSLNATYNWDGVAYTLEDHTDIVLSNPNLMNMTWPELLARLRADAGYVSAFKATYPQGLTPANVLDAIASFERSLLTPNARFDRYLRGERDALTAREAAGYRLFKAYGCASCHQGVNLGGNLYQKFGVFEELMAAATASEDLGRIYITHILRDRQVFRVPGLRNIALTAPYFHDGRARTLEEAVDIMAKAQLGRELAAEEIGLIVDFLHTLTGEYQGRPLRGPGAEAR